LRGIEVLLFGSDRYPAANSHGGISRDVYVVSKTVDICGAFECLFLVCDMLRLISGSSSLAGIAGKRNKLLVFIGRICVQRGIQIHNVSGAGSYLVSG
jgi:hypothetical protein